MLRALDLDVFVIVSFAYATVLKPVSHKHNSQAINWCFERTDLLCLVALIYTFCIRALKIKDRVTTFKELHLYFMRKLTIKFYR